MAKGGTKTSEGMAQKNFGTAENAASTSGMEANQSYGQLMPLISQMLSPGGDPAVTAAITGALGSSFGAEKQGVADTAARTGNYASSNAATDQLARSQGSAAAQAAANSVGGQHKEAAQLLAQIFGGASKDQTANINAATGANNAYSTAVKTGGGVTDPILQTVGAILGAGGKIRPPGSGPGAGGPVDNGNPGTD